MELLATADTSGSLQVQIGIKYQNAGQIAKTETGRSLFEKVGQTRRTSWENQEAGKSHFTRVAEE